MIAILTESFAGKWPFWLSPRQAIVIPIGPQFDEYSEKVRFNLLSNNIIHNYYKILLGKKRDI